VTEENIDDRLWRGETLETRAAGRRRQLLDAGYRLMGDGGSAAVTMRAVVREAELSPRYFYESFANTDELIVAVYDHCNAQLAEALAGALLGGAEDLDGLIRAAVTEASSFFLAESARVQILVREPLSNTMLGSRRIGGAQELLGPLMLLLEAEAPGAGAVDEGRLKLAVSSLSGSFTFLILDWLDGRLEASQEQLVEHATRLARFEIEAVLG